MYRDIEGTSFWNTSFESFLVYLTKNSMDRLLFEGNVSCLKSKFETFKVLNSPNESKLM